MTETGSGVNPFPGLRSFEPEEAYLYFGRDENLDELLQRLRTTRFLAILGTSGSGKSSLVKAGLIPSLHSGYMTSAGSSWRVALLRPGNDPIGNLAQSLNSPAILGGPEEPADLQRAFIEVTLRRSALGLVDAVDQARLPKNDNLLVIADQFEELFRFRRSRETKDSGDEATAFVKLLLQAARQEGARIYVVLTMRSHFIGDCMSLPGLPEAINSGQYLVPRMTRDQLHAAVAGPVAVGGAGITPRLVSKLMNEVGDDPDQLPVLQHALMQIWDFWAAKHTPAEPLDLPHYEAIGTMKQALSRHAEEAYQELESERAKDMAERMFKALTEKDSDNRRVRRPAPLGELSGITQASGDELSAVIEPFRQQGRSFLMPPAGHELDENSVVDLSHESLIRLWDRLRTWVEEEAVSARVYLRLAEATRLNREGKAGLWRDPELQLGLNWREENQPTAEWAQRYNPDFPECMSFLERSQAEREREIAQAEQERRRKLRQARVLAVVLGSAALITLVLALGMTYLWDQTKQAELRSRGRLLVSRSASETEDKFDLPILLAVHAYQVNGDEASKSNLVRQLQRPSERLWLTLRGHQGPVVRVAWSPDGETLASASYDRTVKLWEAESGRLLFTLTGHKDLVTTLTWSPEGKFLASGGTDNDVRLWEGATGKLLHVLSGHQGPINRLAWKPDGTVLASGGGDGAVRLWSLESGQLMSTLSEHTAEVTALAWSQEGLASGSVDQSVLIWDLPEKVRWKLDHPGAITSLAWGEGPRLASATDSGVVRVWNAQSGRQESTLQAHDPGFTTVAWGKGAGPSPVQSMLISGGADGRIRFHGDNALEEAMQTEVSGRVTSIDWSPNAKTLASGGSDAQIDLWAPSGFIANLVGHEEEVRSVAWAPDGRLLASASFDGTIRLWRSEPQQIVRTLPGHERNAEAIAWSPDGVLVASGGHDESVKIWQVSSGELLATLLQPGSEAIRTVAWRRDGKFLAAAGSDGTIGLWNVQSGQLVSSLSGHEDEVSSLAWSPNSKILASAGWDQVTKLWDGENGRSIRTLAGHEDEVNSVAWSPDGSTLATASVDQTIRLWDPQTGEHIRTLSGHDGIVNCVAWNRNGEILASGGADRTVRLWDPTSGQLIRILEEHQQEVTGLSWYPSFARLASSSRDRTIKVWDAATGKLLVTLNGHDEVVNQVAWSPNPEDNRLASAGLGGKVKVWELAEQRWLDRARDVVNRNLTQAEWQAVVGSGIPLEKTFPSLREAVP